MCSPIMGMEGREAFIKALLSPFLSLAAPLFANVTYWFQFGESRGCLWKIEAASVFLSLRSYSNPYFLLHRPIWAAPEEGSASRTHHQQKPR